MPMSASDCTFVENAVARCVQFVPSLDTNALNWDPVRESDSQIGNCEGDRPPIHSVSAPEEGRVNTSTRPDGVTSTRTCAADGSSESRIISPALAKLFVLSRLLTRNTIWPSSFRLW